MKKLDVCLTAFSESMPSRLVGTLAEADRRVYFEYDAGFLAAPLWLSPFKLPPEPGLHEHRDRAFAPLFGLFDDSLPDGWGLMLMDRHFRQMGMIPDTVSPLDRLAYLGTHTMGALTYHPPADIPPGTCEVLDLHDMAREAYLVVEGKGEDVLPQLLRAGGSPGGARPKVLIGVKDDQVISGEADLPDGFTPWLVKFHSRADAVDDGKIEYAYSLMAREAGIDMSGTRLFPTRQGEVFFGVERFDRADNRRRHVHTFGNLIHANFRVPCCDYALLMKVTRVLTKCAADVTAAFRLMVFNILVHNRDDHVKNFAFILSPEGEWHLSPAYDLTFSPGPGGEHTMTVASEGVNPGFQHIMQIAEGAGIGKRQAEEVVTDVAAAVSQWPRFAGQAGLDSRRMNEIRQRFPRLTKKP